MIIRTSGMLPFAGPLVAGGAAGGIGANDSPVPLVAAGSDDVVFD